MIQFLINGGVSYSYDELLKNVGKDGYTPFLKTHDIFHYFSNLVKALVNNKPLTLLDSDLNMLEINEVDEGEVNEVKPLKVKAFATMDEVVEALQQSESEITIFTSGTTGQPKKCP